MAQPISTIQQILCRTDRYLYEFTNSLEALVTTLSHWALNILLTPQENNARKQSN